MTPAGEALVGHAEDILWRVQSARADLASRSNGRSSVLRVGVTASVAGGLLERVLRALAARTPQLRVHPVESASDGTLLDLVEQGEADVAFADLPLPSGPFKSRTILRDPWILLASESSEWVERREPPTVEELAEAPLIMLEGARSTGHLEAWFRSHGVVSKPAARAASDTTLRAFVAAGLGVAVVPGLAAPAWDARTVAIDLEGLVPSRCLGICWHSGRAYGGALQAFCEVTSEVAHRGEGRPI